MFALASGGEGGATPFIVYYVILRTRPQDDIVEQSATVGSVSAAEHRRFLSENRQSRCCGKMKVNFRKRKFSIY